MILVTGATGFLGAEVCRRLIEKGYSVLGIGRKQYGFLDAKTLASKRFQFLQLELKNLHNESLANIANCAPRACIHLASMVEYASSDYHDYHDYHDYTITPTINLINLAQHLQIKKIIYSSTSSVIAKPSPTQQTSDENTPISPMSNYGLSKYVCEKLLELATLKTPTLSCIALRFPAIYGRNHLGGIIHTLKEQILHHQEVELYGRGKYLRNVLFVSDAVDAIILALESELSGYELFTIGASESLSVLEIAQHLINLTHSRSRLILSAKESPNNFNAQLDTSKAQRMLGYTPRSIESGLKDYIATLDSPQKDLS